MAVSRASANRRFALRRKDSDPLVLMVRNERTGEERLVLDENSCWINLRDYPFGDPDFDSDSADDVLLALHNTMQEILYS